MQTIYLYNQNFFLLPRLKSALKKLLGKSRGPEAVFNSLSRGLTELGVDFKVNANISEPVNIVCVLSGVETLRWAIAQKQKGKTKILIAGPNLVQTPNDYNAILTAEEIDLCLVPSEQVKIAYERYNPKLRGRIHVWYTGVNQAFWSPLRPRPEAKNILLYCKKAPEQTIIQTSQLIEALGLAVLRIDYGKYDGQDYKRMLSESLAAIFFSPSESQGIALAEAWSMDVPTLVWNPKQKHPDFADMLDSPAPYLTDSTGSFWETTQDLEKLILNLKISPRQFAPRDWLVKNMSDFASAKLFLNIIGTKQ